MLSKATCTKNFNLFQKPKTPASQIHSLDSASNSVHSIWYTKYIYPNNFVKIWQIITLIQDLLKKLKPCPNADTEVIASAPDFVSVSLKYALSENFLKIEFNTLRSILVPLKYTKYHTDKREKNTLYCMKYHCCTMITQNKKLKQTVFYWTIFKSD